uniref:non-specific serine/threonine protein kinase n=1 Tax=Oryza brachyantha TaxID=4533 RepID=J3LNL6_ORYBR
MQLAIKMINKVPKGTPCSEVEAMVKLSGLDHVVQMYSAWCENVVSGQSDVYIGMEFFERNLEEYLTARTVVDLQKSTRIFTEILAGVNSIHEAGIIHRDLKPMNILIDSSDHICVTDFGIAKIKPYPAAELSYPGCSKYGTQFYCDPILNSPHHQHDEKVDIYSCGIIYFEMHLLGVTKRRSSHFTEKALFYRRNYKSLLISQKVNKCTKQKFIHCKFYALMSAGFMVERLSVMTQCCKYTALAFDVNTCRRLVMIPFVSWALCGVELSVGADDELVWKLSADRRFSVAASTCGKLIWKTRFPTKVKLFMWVMEKEQRTAYPGGEGVAELGILLNGGGFMMASSYTHTPFISGQASSSSCRSKLISAWGTGGRRRGRVFGNAIGEKL